MSGPSSWSALADEVSAAGARFGAPLGAGERLALERRLGVELPTDYRWVLEQVGAGSSDGPPYYGLASPKEPRDIDERPAHPERPFPLTKPWVWEDDPEIDEARLDAVWQHGWLWLGTDGCGMDWALVVSGSARGQVWSLTDVGAAPYGEGAGFATWLGDWLAGGPIWRFGSDTVDWLRAFTRPVAKVEAGGAAGGHREVRVWLREPHDGAREPRACGFLDVVVDLDGTEAGTPTGARTTPVAQHGMALAMPPRGARLLWGHVRPDALAALASRTRSRRWRRR